MFLIVKVLSLWLTLLFATWLAKSRAEIEKVAFAATQNKQKVSWFVRSPPRLIFGK
jgi:hypothetical protein